MAVDVTTEIGVARPDAEVATYAADLGNATAYLSCYSAGRTPLRGSTAKSPQ